MWELGGPFVVAKEVSKVSYEKWCLNVESSWKVAYYPTSKSKGAVLLYGDPTKVHDGIVEWLKSRIQRQVDDVLRGKGLYFDEVVYLLGTSSHDGTVKQPDAAYTSACARPPRKPRMTIEVAYKNEGFENLVEEVKLWHSSGIELSLGIKIQVKLTGKKGKKALVVAMYWVQQYANEDKPTVLEFSPGVCTEPNMPEFRVHFPLSCLADVDSSLDVSISFDLHGVQQKIWNLILDEAEDNRSIISYDTHGLAFLEEDSLCAECLEGFKERKMIQCDGIECGSWYTSIVFGCKQILMSNPHGCVMRATQQLLRNQGVI